MSSLDFDLIATTDRYADGEPAAQILERRWFAALAAVNSLRAECDVLLGVVELAEEAWRRTSAQVAQLEALGDALGERLAAMDEPRITSRLDTVRREVMSAA